MLAKLSSKLKQYKRALSNLGVWPFIFYKFRTFANRIGKTEGSYVLYSKHAKFPLDCRANTSDRDVFDQIFLNREYRCLDDVHEARLIIDCGAYVGYSASYLLTRFPNAYLIAVEPDPENFAILKTNLAPYKNTCRAICSAVWSKPVGLVVSEVPFGDGREWARTVREARPDEKPTMTGVNIGTLLNNSGFDRISILKIDIEGAESNVFSSDYESWIEKVDNLVIELHSEGCGAAFRKAISGIDFDISECDELTVCKRLS
jgi:FkbM family methyltransferase